jgi:hypothetical protein
LKEAWLEKIDISMIRWFYHLSDYMFWFTAEQKKTLSNLAKDPEKRSDFRTWFVATIALPLVTYAVAVFFNFLLEPTLCALSRDWTKVVLNGSVPIISFGIISSGVSYLMEKLDKDTQGVQGIRKRIMAYALVFLFLTSVLYIFQSIPKLGDEIQGVGNMVILVLTLAMCLGSVSIGAKMYLLQKSVVEGGDLIEGITENVNDQTAELNQFFGDGN